MTEACLTFDNLTLGYNRHLAVHHMKGVVRKGSLVAVVGGDGSGKSTLMKGMIGLVRAIASEAGLKLGGTLYSDALSPAGGPAPTYIDMMRYNVQTLISAINRS